MASEFGRIKRVDPLEVRKNEAPDFTPWLRDNIDLLGQTQGLGEAIATGQPYETRLDPPPADPRVAYLPRKVEQSTTVAR